MLLRFSFSNHLSINKTQEISLVASALSDSTESVIDIPSVNENGCLSSLVLYGANAAGKSNVISALKRMQHEVKTSFIFRRPNAMINRSVFALDQKCKKIPTTFEVDFIVDSVRYQYGYTCNNKQYLEEWLYSFPNGTVTKLFDRKKQEFSFGRFLKGYKKIIADLTRENSLFLSAAVQNNHEFLTKIGSFFNDIQDDTQIAVNGTIAAQELAQDKLDQRAIKMLAQLGTGVSSYKIDEQDIPEDRLSFRKKSINAFSDTFEDIPSDANERWATKERSIKLGHFDNSNDIVFFDFQRESAGTRRLLVILGPIFKALDDGGLILIDEFDASLHTKACELILALFNNKKTNPKGAQLVVTTHDTNLLRSDYLRRDQIWFAEKDETGATHIYPLTDISVQKSANLERGYLQGRFGAVPFSGSVEQFLRLQDG